MQSLSFNTTKKLNLICLGAHCDDIEIGCGGTLLKFFQNYEINSVRWVVFASNAERKQEATNCANNFLQKIKNKSITVLDYRDGFLPFHAIEIKEYFESIKNEIEPDLIFTHYRNDRHQDHRLVSDLTWNTWRNHIVLEYEIPKYDGDLGNPNFYVNLDDDLLQKKISFILEAFKSQNSKHWFDENTFSALPRIRGMESVSKYAEAFYARKITLN